MPKNKHIPISEPDLTGNEKKYLIDCIDSTWISSRGKYIELFEKEFAGFTGVKHAVSTFNGTVALHLVLEALGVGEGDEVIVPDLTYIATASAVCYTGAKPVFADVEKESWNIDPVEIEKKITKKTKAIIPVHLYGMPCDMNKIMKIAYKYNLFVVEDAAEAHGASIKIKEQKSKNKNKNQEIKIKKPAINDWRKVGSIGHAGCFSFYGNKILTTGEGGMVTTNDDDLYEKMLRMKDHFMDEKKKYYHHGLGYNYRMTNMQAAVGLAQLERIDGFIKEKVKLARRYNQAFSKEASIQTPVEKESIRNVYWMYSIVLKEKYPVKRDKLMAVLAEKGIETRPFFYPLHLQPVFSSLKDKKNYPNTKYLAERGLNLPSSVKLSNENITKVISQILTRE